MKRFLFATFNTLTAALFPLSVMMGAESHAGLIAQWNLNEGVGTTTVDSVASNDGTLNGNVLWVADHAPVPGNNFGVQFGGTVPDFIGFGTSSALSPGSISVALWAKATGNHTTSSLFAKFDAVPGSFEMAFSLPVSGIGHLFFRAWDTSGAQVFAGQSATDPFTAAEFNDNQWHHFAGTMNKATGAVSLYVDGTLIETLFLGADLGLNPTNHVLRAGRRGFPGVEIPYNGELDYIQIYDHALTQQEITDLARPVPEPSTLTLFGIGSLAVLGYSWRRRWTGSTGIAPFPGTALRTGAEAPQKR